MPGKTVLLVLLVSATLGAVAETPPPPSPGLSPQVTLPLAEFERLKRLDERTSLTVVDTLRLGGSFQAKNLTVSFSGRSAGRLPTETVLEADDGTVIYGCEGEGIVSRGEAGFALTPLSAAFTLRCRLAVRGSDRLELTIPRGVLWVESSVSDGEIVPGPSPGGGKRLISVVRRAARAPEALPPSATGRYRITLRPDETRFRYEIEARNPNRSRHTFNLTLGSDEHVQQVDASVPYDIETGRYRFDLPPGDSKLTLTGTLGGTSFAPPVEASLQYALLEGHPLLRVSVSGAAKKVSPSEVGIAAEFRGAQAFLIGKGEKLAWSVTRLEALHTTSYAVKVERHVLFVAAGGAALGESTFTIDNQGASEVTAPARPEPTFASFQNEPVLLTKNAQGDLWLPLGHGVQQLLIQYRQEFGRSLGIAHGTLLLPRLSAAASRASVEVRYPTEWLPLLEGFASEDHFHLPGRPVLLFAVLVFLFTERALALLGLPRGRRFPPALLLTLAALVWGDAAWAVLIADLGVMALVAAPSLIRLKWTGQRIALAIASAIVVGIAVLVLTPSLQIAPKKVSYDAEISRNVFGSQSSGRPAQQVAAESPKVAEEPVAYQGLPARFDLPAGAHRSFFSREMLAAGGPREVRILAISKKLAFWLAAIVVLAAAAAVTRLRREILAGWKTSLVEARVAWSENKEERKTGSDAAAAPGPAE